MSMQLRRLIVAGVSILVGVLLTYAIVYLRQPLIGPVSLGPIPLGPVTFGFGTDVAHFALSNVVLLGISIAGVVAIWLDYFMDTKILKS